MVFNQVISGVGNEEKLKILSFGETGDGERLNETIDGSAKLAVVSWKNGASAMVIYAGDTVNSATLSEDGRNLSSTNFPVGGQTWVALG